MGGEGRSLTRVLTGFVACGLLAIAVWQFRELPDEPDSGQLPAGGRAVEDRPADRAVLVGDEGQAIGEPVIALSAPVAATSRWSVRQLPVASQRFGARLRQLFESLESSNEVDRVQAKSDLDLFLKSPDAQVPAGLRAVLALEPSESLRRTLIAALARSDADEAVDALREEFETRFDDPNAREYLRYIVLETGRMTGKASLEALSGWLADPRLSPEAKESALFALSQRSDARERSELFRAVAVDKKSSAKMRSRAARTLGVLSVADANVLEQVRDILPRLEDSALAAALSGMGKSRSPVAIELLIEHARDGNSQAVRKAALESLARTGVPTARAELQSLFESEVDVGLKRHIGRWIASTRRGDSSP